MRISPQIGLAVAMLAIPGGALRAQTARPPGLRPMMTEGLDVDEKVGRTIDLNLTFKDETGAVVPLRSFFNQGRPVILDLVYYRCPKLCNLMLNGQVMALRELPYEAGKDYELVTVSIDPKETPEIAREKKQNYANTYHRSVAGWHFLTDNENHTKPLADLLGFKYRFDPGLDQYIHAATFMVLTSTGKVSRYLYGTRFKTFDMRMAITEASRGETRFSVEKILQICFRFDPNAKGYVVAASRLMEAAAGIMVVLFGLWLWRFLQWEKVRAARGLNRLNPSLKTGER
ncbi:MAG TPA: SCO family protein [Bryobacteraceae bacterium]